MHSRGLYAEEAAESTCRTLICIKKICNLDNEIKMKSGKPDYMLGRLSNIFTSNNTAM